MLLLSTKDATTKFFVRAVLWLTSVTVVLGTTACSLRAKPAATSPFLGTTTLPQNLDNHLAWNSVEGAPDKQVLELSQKQRKIFVGTVTAQFLNSAMKEDARPKLHGKDVDAMTALLHDSFEAALAKSAGNFVTTSNPRKADLSVTIALTELTPTKPAVNTVADVGALAVPGSKVLQSAVAVAAPAVGAPFSAGSIAIEVKVVDRKTRKTLLLAKDRQTDPASVIPNYRDFLAFGWARLAVKNWSEQFAKAFSTSIDTHVSSGSTISVVPW